MNAASLFYSYEISLPHRAQIFLEYILRSEPVPPVGFPRGIYSYLTSL